jgi:diaminopimelate epimerase
MVEHGQREPAIDEPYYFDRPTALCHDPRGLAQCVRQIIAPTHVEHRLDRIREEPMNLHFTKMQGAGNDYVYVDEFAHPVPAEAKPSLARQLADRHFGVGGDGLIFIRPSDEADAEMEMYNADGSYGSMCGNGIRCVGKYLYDRDMVPGKEFTVISDGSVKHLKVTETDENGHATMLRVNMGMPELDKDAIPVTATHTTLVDDAHAVVNDPIKVRDTTYRMTCVSMGNPHAVVFVDDVVTFPLAEVGPLFEHNVRFPERTNTEFVQVISRDYVRMRVWERGSGETLACGTGCCATCVACVLNGKTASTITVEVRGGKIQITWDRETDQVFMTGPATEVFSGDVEVGFEK